WLRPPSRATATICAKVKQQDKHELTKAPRFRNCQPRRRISSCREIRRNGMWHEGQCCAMGTRETLPLSARIFFLVLAALAVLLRSGIAAEECRDVLSLRVTDEIKVAYRQQST